MTNAEHKLMVTMLATQLSLTGSLIELLCEKDVISPSDRKKMMKAANSPGPAHEAYISSVRVLYVACAKILGLDPDLDRE